jgi:hypothetical protein
VISTGTRAHVLALRPHGHLFRQGNIAFLALITPLFAALYWLTIPRGEWVPVLVVQVILTVTYVFGFIASLRAMIWVEPAAITERGFFGRTTRIETTQVAGIVMLDLYRSGALDTLPQLFVTDSNGCLLLRMRGQFWSPSAMATLTEALGVPVERVPRPMTLRELNRERPQLLYWFERTTCQRFPEPLL